MKGLQMFLIGLGVVTVLVIIVIIGLSIFGTTRKEAQQNIQAEEVIDAGMSDIERRRYGR